MPDPSVIFDMDGLLLDTEKVKLDSFVETRRYFSLSESPDTFLRCVGLHGCEPDRVIRESLNGQTDLQSFRKEWVKRIDARMSNEIPQKPGAARVVQILASKGHLMGVATSTHTERARSLLERSGLLLYFECVIGGDLVEKHKPNPEVYHSVAALLRVNAADCVVFEDSETGTRAAVASGARTIQVPDLIPPSDDLAKLGHVIAPSLLEGALEIGLITSSDI